MTFIPDIQAFCCHYTSQQTLADGNSLKDDGFPDNITINRLPCTGKLQVSTLLKAFEDGADGVYVVGCPLDECHNLKGSQRAAKRVLAIKKALAELDEDEGRIEMFHQARGFQPEFITVAQEMNKNITALGSCQLKGESK
jgi:coenzyme F420-reducing hydrogenase delta subunit